MNSTTPSTCSERMLHYLPLAGIFAFTLLYVMATLLYPGGSDADPKAEAFSWLHNYWCELLAPSARNGQVNAARPAAVTAMYVLVVSLSLIWYSVPRRLLLPGKWQVFISASGICSMAVLFFLKPGNHDLVIHTAAILGALAILLTCLGLHRTKHFRLAALGILCLLLCGLNSWVYFSSDRSFLPVIQKISFALFLCWFGWLRWRV